MKGRLFVRQKSAEKTGVYETLDLRTDEETTQRALHVASSEGLRVMIFCFSKVKGTRYYQHFQLNDPKNSSMATKNSEKVPWS